ncbi:DUF3572 domain-containing protein [Chachezhania antarctica]|uniref:DUF3572 domain-containing protein n=1 Tax=Chachezhania antarctica TaxID=2340860 RepID=UPI000EABBEB8|nr:DUF3572 domain-containing protein [Chachezhania antarctica]|tara:strand:- start:481 stop:759 length:279 start_codon:yes stop_codon:yes gene_type:complete
MNPDAAETFALDVLTWLAGSDDLMPVFLGSTGASIDDLRDRAGDAEFLGAVLDFLMLDDAWVMAFAESRGIDPERVMRARAALPGGQQVNWT